MKREHQWLQQLTSLPTASGLEDLPISWVEAWARRRKGVRVTRDAVGNVVLAPTGRTRRPLVWIVPRCG